mgnify:CR=1 FL=1
MINKTATCLTRCIGKNSTVWQYCVILEQAKIGSNTNICSHCFIENDVVIGDNVTIKNGVFLWDGTTVEDNVFIGPGVTFTNDKYPRSKQWQEQPCKTLIKNGASIGANATILPGLTIGKNAIVGAGAVVINSVPPNAIVAGNPARITGYADSISKDKIASVSVNREDISMKQKKIFSKKIKNIFLMSCEIYNDIRGDLAVSEFNNSLPFIPKRIFHVYNVPSSEVRGEHAHHECHQFLIAIKGAVNVFVDNGKTNDVFVLNSPKIGLYIPPKTWSSQYNYSSDAVLMVLASHHYKDEDYIRDYDDFLLL